MDLVPCLLPLLHLLDWHDGIPGQLGSGDALLDIACACHDCLLFRALLVGFALHLLPTWLPEANLVPSRDRTDCGLHTVAWCHRFTHQSHPGAV